MKKFIAGLSMMVCLCLAAGAANTFTAVSGDWNVPGNWSEGVPAAGQEVVIDGDATLTNATPALASLAVAAGKTLAFDGWDTVLTATTVSITGTVTHAINGDMVGSDGWTPNARVYIVCDTLDIPVGGKIDGNAKGYRGATATTAAGPGYGPGGGRAAVTGAGYGGKGGRDNGGLPYGSASIPTDPGSGGGSGDRAGRPGGHGGGAVYIDAANAVTVNGIIQVNGVNGSTGQGGGGSGGSIYIACNTFEGSGTLSAAGGTGGSGGAGAGTGGGGRISIEYNQTAQSLLPLPAARLTTEAGVSGNNWDGDYGGMGSLYFPDNQFLSRQTGAFVHVGQWMVTGINEIALDSLTMVNGGLGFIQEGFVLTVTNNLSLKGSNANLYRMELTNGVLNCGGDMTIDKGGVVMTPGSTPSGELNCVGDLVLTNSARMIVYPGITGSHSQYGALVSVGGAFTIADASQVLPYSHPTNGASVFFDVGSLTMEGGSIINAAGKGYAGNQYLKDTRKYGFGPGGGKDENYGGSYGGIGSGADATKTYGVASAPIEPGSGGGGRAYPSGEGGGAGGGLVWIDSAADVVINNSSILANGGNGSTSYGGGGSGGGIFITCAKIQGVNGLVNASGGTGGTTQGDSGGGGRIAVIYDAVKQATVPVPGVLFTANTGVAKFIGQPGTLYFTDNQLLERQTGFISHVGSWLSGVPFTVWNRDGLVLSNGYLRLPDGLEINVTNEMVVSGTDPAFHKLVGAGVVINAGSLRLDKSAAFEVIGSIVTNPAIPGAEVNVAGEMSIGPNAWVYPVSHPTNGGSPKFTVGSLTVDATGGFNALGKGFAGGTVGSAGFGPGAGGISVSTTDRGAGGGYGAQGTSVGFCVGGLPYGSASYPTQPGSGGGAQTNSLTSVGGYGGGLVWVEATGAINLDGTINVNGGEATGNSGAGSGGGVNLRCGTFNGKGKITATGGSWYIGGGGGRIAVVYTDVTTQALLSPSVSFNAASILSSGAIRSFGNGSLYFPDTTFFPYPTLTGSYDINIPTMVPTWNASSLVVTNGEIHFPLGSSISISGDLAIGKAGVVVFTNNPEVAFGNISITNGGVASFFAEATNGVAPAYGAKVQVDGKMLVGDGSTANVCSERLTGGSVFFDVENLDVEASGKINADARGFACGGARGINGHGPGGGVGHWGSDRGGGGGYGGSGATHTNNVAAAGGPSYGSSILPVYPGSGGGDAGGFGGGLIWMRVHKNALVNGTISANGGSVIWTKGDGSGGGIFLDCGSFEGSGTLSANGGVYNSTSAANGGGGRIAVWENVSEHYRNKFYSGNTSGAVIYAEPPVAFTGTAAATAGPYGCAGLKAEPGTVVFLTAPPVETLLIVR